MKIPSLPKFIRAMAIILITLIAFTAPVLAATDPFSDACNIPGTPGTPSPSTADACQPDGSDPISGDDGIIMAVVNVIAILAGVTSVIIIIIAGFQMVLSGGDAQKVANARSAIIYALVGVIFIIVSRAVIAFVVTELAK